MHKLMILICITLLTIACVPEVETPSESEASTTWDDMSWDDGPWE